MKRSVEEAAAHPHSHKKHKKDHSRPDHHNSVSHEQHHHSNDKHKEKSHKAAKSHADAVSHLPSPKSESGPVPAYIHFTIPKGLPPLPPVKSGPLSTAPFKHKSTINYDRSSSTTDITYERLEFLGDAYIELIASRLIFERFGQLPAGQQSQLRELLVKNETLGEYSRAYGFEKRVEAGSMDRMAEASKQKGNKGFNKVLGDVFEAYVAAVILSDVEDGFAISEKWLTALWAPKLVEAAKNDRGFAYNPNLKLTHDANADVSKIYNPNAKQELQKRIMANSSVKLLYEKYKDPIELKGDQLGQNRHFIALYLTGYGHEKKLLGKGEGKNKVEAGNWAATEAMHGEGKNVVIECEKKMITEKEAKRAKQAAAPNEKTAEN